MNLKTKQNQGLAYLNEDLKDTAEEYYEDERVNKILSTKHIPTPADFDLMGDMINKLNSLYGKK